MTTSTKRPDEVLRALEPYIDCIICYASTVDEHEGNRVAKMVRDYFATPTNESPAPQADEDETGAWADLRASGGIFPEAYAVAQSENVMTEDQIKHMVNRFLMWKLPRDTFNPDCGISFDKKPYNTHTAHPSQHEPSGTNLFDATQADAMVRYMIDGLPTAPQSAPVFKASHNSGERDPSVTLGCTGADTAAPQPPVEGLRELLKQIEFSSNGYCPVCNGWVVDKGKHTPECKLAHALASPSLTAGENTKSDGGEHGGERTRTVQAGLDDGLGPMQAVPQAADACSAPSDPPLEDALGHLGSVLSILAELHPDDRSRALDNALAFYNARRPGAQVEPVAGVTRLVYQWPGPSDPSHTAPAPDVREAMHRASEAEAEAGRLSYLIKEGIYSEYDDKMVSLSIMDESEASIGMYGPVYLALADTHQIIPSRLFEAMVTSLGDNFEKLQAIYAEDSTLSAQPAKGER